MDRKTFEEALARDGYDVTTSTTPGASFDVRAVSLVGRKH